MNTNVIQTERLILRQFTENDMNDLHLILKDEEVNKFMPWFPSETFGGTINFYESRIAPNYEKGWPYFYAVCLKKYDRPIGYIKADSKDSYDFGYALLSEFQRKGFITEAGKALIEKLRSDGIPYITATHDVNNPRSGSVMKRLGMKYQYSYEEQWQPKNFPVIFRMYQLDLNGRENKVYNKYREIHGNSFIEKGV